MKNSVQVMPVLFSNWTIKMAILIDTFNLYHATRLRFKGKAIDYSTFLEHLRQLYPDEGQPIAYVARSEKAQGFIKYLQTQLGLYVKMKEIRSTKNDNFDIELTLDALDTTDKNIIICSSSLNLVPLLSRLTKDRRVVHVHASGIPRLFNDYCLTNELGLWMMKSRGIEDETPVTT